jgi:hypothetical protein
LKNKTSTTSSVVASAEQPRQNVEEELRWEPGGPARETPPSRPFRIRTQRLRRRGRGAAWLRSSGPRKVEWFLMRGARWRLSPVIFKVYVQM